MAATSDLDWHSFITQKIDEMATSNSPLADKYRSVLQTIVGDDVQITNETHLRLRHFTVQGKNVRRARDDGSLANFATFTCVKGLIVKLREVYGDTMNANVAIITPFVRQEMLYNDLLRSFGVEGLSEDALPPVVIIGAAAGRK